jgi:Fe2+ transport system protein FeoA
MYLSESHNGKHYIIAEIVEPDEKKKFRIYELGFTPKSKIKVVQNNRFGVVILKNTSRYAIDLETASRIGVEAL